MCGYMKAVPGYKLKGGGEPNPFSASDSCAVDHNHPIQ